MRPAIFVLALVACQSSEVSRGIGARCDRNSECDDRCLAPSTDWPGGFCTVSCDSDADCPSDAACIDEGSGGVCAFECIVDAHCEFLGAGYGCKQRDLYMVDARVMVCRGA